VLHPPRHNIFRSDSCLLLGGRVGEALYVLHYPPDLFSRQRPTGHGRAWQPGEEPQVELLALAPSLEYAFLQVARPGGKALGCAPGGVTPSLAVLAMAVGASRQIVLPSLP